MKKRQKKRPRAISTAVPAMQQHRRQQAAQREAAGGDQVHGPAHQLRQVELAGVGQHQEEQPRQVPRPIAAQVGQEGAELAEHCD